MSLLIAVLLFQRAGISALPTLSPNVSGAPTPDFPPDITIATGTSAERTLWSILWSCLATTFACTWVSVHPNIPCFQGRKFSTKAKIWLRIYFTIISFVAPEIMTFWAFKQLLGAWSIMYTVNGSWWVKVSIKTGADRVVEPAIPRRYVEQDTSPFWTLTHAQYLQMGGYRLQCLPCEEELIPSRYGRRAKVMLAGEEREVWELPLSFGTMKTAFNEGYIDIPFIPKDEILDKNGRDGLSKAFAMLQLTWFIVQIAARVRQNLAITALELTTAALAVFNIAMYISWWSKPTDIHYPTQIMTKELQKQNRRWARMYDDGALEDADGVKAAEDRDDAMILVQIDDMINPQAASHYRIEGKIVPKKKNKGVPRGPGPGAEWLALVGISSSGRAPSLRRRQLEVKHFSLEMGRCIRKTLVNFCNLLLAFTYVPILAITGSGKRVWDQQRYEGDFYQTMMDDSTTVQHKTSALLTIMDTIFFCEDVASTLLLCLSALSGAIFGTMHCLAWNFAFPSHVEQILWRTSSTVISGICICIAIAPLVNIIIPYQHPSPSWPPATPLFPSSPPPSPMTSPPSSSSPARWILDPDVSGVSHSMGFICIVFAFCFALSRLALLILSVAQLRGLPVSAFDAVEWLEFFPHI